MTISKGPRIQALLDQISSRITQDRYEDVADYIRFDEWQLAVEMLAESLAEQEATLSPTEWDTFDTLAKSVSVNLGSYRLGRSDDR